VVAPTLDAAAILSALRERVDPAFLPRPLLLVEALPRNETGKLPQQALQALATRLTAPSTDCSR
jgi:acyl-coenzyme A synthetase/AMP-(fatty) acid ligase